MPGRGLHRDRRHDRFAQGPAYRYRPGDKRITAGTVQTIKVRLTGAQLRTLRAALRVHKRATLKVTVNAVDAAGNVVTRTLRVKVKR